MDKLKNKEWWKDVAERTVATMAESALAVIGTNALGLTDVDWLLVGSVALLSGVATVLRALVTLKDK